MHLNRGGIAMESLTDQGEPSYPPAAVAGTDSTACPRLVLLPCHGKRTDDFSAVADAKTTSAASYTSTGRRFRVSFGLAPSPEISSFCYALDDPPADYNDRHGHWPIILAAQKDCILLEVTLPSNATSSLMSPQPRDYFLYQALTAGLPPSLLLLPPCYSYSPMQYDAHGRVSSPPIPCDMTRDGIAILRRGGDVILVTQLLLTIPNAGELCLLRPGRDREWQLDTRVPIVIDDDGTLQWWHTNASFVVGDRFLCWVDYLCGFLFTDVAAVELRLWYAPLPIVPPSGNPEHTEGGRSNMARSRNLAPTGDSSVRFVDVESRCCCGDPGSTSCQHGHFLFNMSTWTLKLSIDESMEWVKDGVLDCDELWAQPGYMGLPRLPLEYPIVVNSDDPDVVWFVIDTDYHYYGKDSVMDKKVRTIEVDTRRKVLRSVVPYNGSDIHHPRYGFFQAKFCTEYLSRNPQAG